MSTSARLLIFSRYPEAGTTKTRLIPELGAEAAAQLQERLTERVLLQAGLLKQASGIETTVYHAGGNAKQMFSWLGPAHCVPQADGDLGERMSQAFTDTFKNGAEVVVLIGSDIPDIEVNLLQEAFAALTSRELVIGPCEDGGYYLIGMVAKEAHRLLPLLFKEMYWSTGDLYSRTLQRAKAAGFKAAVLKTLRDIDLPSDLFLARKRGLL